MDKEIDIEQRAKAVLREVLSEASTTPYRTHCRAWRDIVASLGFETGADLSLIREFEEHDQARFETLSRAVMLRAIDADEIMTLYLEFFPRPAHYKLGEDPFED
jgi:hypothetical protein